MTTAFAYREIEDSPNVINRNDGEEYAQCECGRMILASYLEGNETCRACYDEKHTCAFCDTMAERELPKSADGHRYCDTCYRENTEATVKHVVREIGKLVELSRQELAQAKEKYVDCGTPNYLAYGAIIAGHMEFLCGQLYRIAGELEGI
jgi:hypothetical protein